jgi:hypothetical protein
MISSKIDNDLEKDWENVTSRDLADSQTRSFQLIESSPKSEKTRSRDKLLNWRNRVLSPLYNLYHARTVLFFSRLRSICDNVQSECSLCFFFQCPQNRPLSTRPPFGSSARNMKFHQMFKYDKHSSVHIRNDKTD